VDSTTTRRDLHVVVSFRAQLLLLEPRLPEYCVGVGIDETRSKDTSATIDYLRVGECGLDITRGPNRGNAPAADGNRGVLQNTSLAHLASLPRAIRPSASDDLRRVDEEKVPQTLLTEIRCTKARGPKPARRRPPAGSHQLQLR
jgi:hypothetical protein